MNEDPLDLIASSHAVAARRGKDTDWPAFQRALKECLDQHGRSVEVTRYFFVLVDEQDDWPSRN